MTKFYAGIGSRKTPIDVLSEMASIAKKLSSLNFVLNSGGAEGADQAFESGSFNSNIFVPWSSFNNYNLPANIPDDAFHIAEKYHPNWTRLSNGARLLMARNVQQVFGRDLTQPVSFVICWTPDACTSHENRSYTTGGTGLAISVASMSNIPVFNLNSKTSRDSFYNDLLPAIERNYE